MKHGVPHQELGERERVLTLVFLSLDSVFMAGTKQDLFCPLISFCYSSNKNGCSEYELCFINVGR